MAINPAAHIDGYDWDISNEPITYPERNRVDACRRALEWRQAQAPHRRKDEWDVEYVVPVRADEPDWVHVCNVIPWDRSRLRVFWNPKSDEVRVERPKPRETIIEVPKPKPLPPEPIQFTFTLKRSPSCPTIAVRLRFYAARGREDLTFPVISMQVPPPPDASQLQWEWTTRLAESRMNVIELPNAFLETPAAERMPMFREAIYARLRQIQDNGGRRH